MPSNQPDSAKKEFHKSFPPLPFPLRSSGTAAVPSSALSPLFPPPQLLLLSNALETARSFSPGVGRPARRFLSLHSAACRPITSCALPPLPFFFALFSRFYLFFFSPRCRAIPPVFSRAAALLFLVPTRLPEINPTLPLVPFQPAPRPR